MVRPAEEFVKKGTPAKMLNKRTVHLIPSMPSYPVERANSRDLIDFCNSPLRPPLMMLASVHSRLDLPPDWEASISNPYDATDGGL
jgi:hypothetical protein